MAAPTEQSSTLPKEAESALQTLALDWVDVVDAKKMEITPLTGGMTNDIFKCSWQTRDGENPRNVLVRIYGDARSNVFFDREYEIQTFKCISRLGQGPRLLASFPNGRIEEFLNARTLSPPDLKNPEISAKIAAKLWEFHHLDIPGPRQPKLWMRLRNWLRTALTLCPDVEVAGFRVDCMEDEINFLEKMLSGEGESVGFCHNDLQYANMMFNDEDKCLTIIVRVLHLKIFINITSCLATMIVSSTDCLNGIIIEPEDGPYILVLQDLDFIKHFGRIC